jgi:sugar phosphate isomerase/epimerase
MSDRIACDTTAGDRTNVSRRRLLGGAAVAACQVGIGGGGALDAGAIEPFVRAGTPRLRLGLAAYGFRQFFRWLRGKPQRPADEMRALTIGSFIDLAADLGCDGAELTSYFFDPATTDTDLLSLRRQAFLRGVAIGGTAVGNNFVRPHGPELDAEIAMVKAWIDRSALLGAPHLRVFAGPVAKGLPAEEARANCIAALEACCEHAATRGVMLGLENHGGIVATADGLLDIVKAVRSPWLGVNLDTGNFHSADPYADLARCVPYAVNVQYKVEVRHGAKGPKEPADVARVVRLLRDGGYQGFVALEYEAAENPYDAVPRHLEELRSLIA